MVMTPPHHLPAARTEAEQLLAEPELVVTPGPEVDLAEIAAGAGLRRVEVLAWRDLDDPEAGGSEVHAAEICRRWVAAGIDVELRASAIEGAPRHVWRDGYRVERRGGRHLLFPRVMGRGAVGRLGRSDGLVEIWNGMPFFSPLWARCPRVVLLHHVHAEMWRMTLRPAALARFGELLEARLAPPVYRGTRIVTLSSSSKQEIVEQLRLPPERIDVIPPGVDERFGPGGRRSPTPLVVAVGRMVPVKRFDLLIDALVEVRRTVPALQAVIAGEGSERARLERQLADAGATGWIQLPGRVDDADLVDLYRRAWVVAAASRREGWGMTLTEAGACATPAVASDIAGHRDAVEDGASGLLFDDAPGLIAGLLRVLGDPALRRRLGAGARRLAGTRGWDEAAAGVLSALAEERRRSIGSGPSTTD
jgi:glycosyltransferase involved in cell wall biosynthesis